MTHAAFSRAPDYKMEAGMHRSFFRPSPALIVACIALMIALGGTGYAALALPANSVGPKQLKANAVTSGKVKDGSLLALDFKRGQLPAGPAGAAGSAGPAGAKGDKGDPGLSAPEITHIDIPIPAHASVGGTVECPAGKRMTGGGGTAPGLPTGVHMKISYPSNDHAWTVYWENTTAFARNGVIYVVCAIIPG